jgi:hypothetical protein
VIQPVPAFPLTYLFNTDPTTGSGVPGAPQYAFGVRSDDGTFWFHLGVGPRDWLKIGSGSGGGGGGTVQAFTYTVTGSEGDKSELTVPLPTSILSGYVVSANCGGCTNVVVADVPSASHASTHFLVSLTGDLVTGDVLAFLVSPITP